MTATVTASELQKNFGLWHDRALKEPVRVTEHGRDSAYLVSAETFDALWASYRRAVSVQELSDAEMALIAEAEIPADRVYEFEDLANEDDAPPPDDASRGDTAPR